MIGKFERGTDKRAYQTNAACAGSGTTADPATIGTGFTANSRAAACPSCGRRIAVSGGGTLRKHTV